MKCPASGKTSNWYLPEKRDARKSLGAQIIGAKGVFTLHLADHELLVQSIGASQNQEFPTLRCKELVTEPSEPIFPVVLCCREVGTPDPGLAGLNSRIGAGTLGK